MRYNPTLIALVLVILAGPLTPQPAQAHILAVDGSMGVTLHVDPQDEPLAGVPSRVYVLFSPKRGSYFSLDECDCRVRIEKGGSVLAERSVTHEAEHAGDSHVVSYEFPERGVYRVVVEGAPVGAPLFEPFRVSFDLRVAREGAGGENEGALSSLLKLHVLHLILIGGACAAAVYLIIKDRRARSVPPSLS